MSKALRGLPTILVGMLLIAVLFTAYTAQQSLAGHEPANKTAAAGSDLDVIGPEGRHVILRDQIRVSTAQDAILSVTSECSILTSLLTGDDETDVDKDGDDETSGTRAQDSAFAFGQVEISIELDGKPVPVSVNDNPGSDLDNDKGEGTDPNGSEMGEVVFCNRAYQRTVQDDVSDNDEGCEDEGEDSDDDGEEGECEGDIDKERDYIRTRTANAFNWLAGNIGDDQNNCKAVDIEQYCFDSLENGNNIIDVVVWAEYDIDTSEQGETPQTDVTTACTTQAPAAGDEVTCALAYVGSRTLIVEPTNVAIHETVGEADGSGN